MMSMFSFGRIGLNCSCAKQTTLTFVVLEVPVMPIAGAEVFSIQFVWEVPCGEYEAAKMTVNKDDSKYHVRVVQCSSALGEAERSIARSIRRARRYSSSLDSDIPRNHAQNARNVKVCREEISPNN